MSFTLTAKDYAEYIKLAYDLIHSKGDYITELDSITGDGDHWTNINMGFESLSSAVPPAYCTAALTLQPQRY